MSTLKIKTVGATDVGKRRSQNEDNLILARSLSDNIWDNSLSDTIEVSGLGTLLVVADGMGGATAGDVASSIAISRVRTLFTDLETLPNSDKGILEFLNNVIYNAHQSILDESLNNPSKKGMGTTLTLGLIKETKLYLAWCGDSRAYRFSKLGVTIKKHYDKDFLQILTSDHSLVWDMVEKGKLTPEEARVHPNSNIITQSLGDAQYTPLPEGKVIELRKGDRILLCSDGLNGMLPDYEIESVLDAIKDTEETCNKLIWLANSAGGEDNITVILADVIDGPPGLILDKEKPRRKEIITQQSVLTKPLEPTTTTSGKEIERKKSRLPLILSAAMLILLGSGLWFLGIFDKILSNPKSVENTSSFRIEEEPSIPKFNPINYKSRIEKELRFFDNTINSFKKSNYLQLDNHFQLTQLFKLYTVDRKKVDLLIDSLKSYNDTFSINSLVLQLKDQVDGIDQTKAAGRLVIKSPTKPTVPKWFDMPKWKTQYIKALDKKVVACTKVNNLNTEDNRMLNSLLEQCKQLTDEFKTIFDRKINKFNTNNSALLADRYAIISRDIKVIENVLQSMEKAQKPVQSITNKILESIDTTNTSNSSKTISLDTTAKNELKPEIVVPLDTINNTKKDTSHQKNN